MTWAYISSEYDASAAPEVTDDIKIIAQIMIK